MKRNDSYLCFIKQMFVLVLFFCSFSTFAQKVKPDDVPQAVKTTFSQEFPNAKVKEWQLKNDQYWVLYKDDGSQQTSIFSTSGSLIETRTPISKQELPGFVMEYVSSEYPGYDVNTCNLLQKPKTKDAYFVEVKKSGVGTGANSELTFTSDGKLLLRKDPDGFAVVKEKPKAVESKTEVVHNEKAPKKQANNDPEENEPKNKTKQNNVKEKAAKNPNAEPEETKKKSKSKKDQYPANIISENNVPPIVKKNFVKKFPKAEDVKWFNKQGDTIYTIKCFFREQNNEIKYTASGKWISQKVELDEKTIFPAVQKYLDKTYRKYELVSCIKTTNFDKNNDFEVKIIELKYKKKKLETTIFFDKMGKLIKTVDPDYSYDAADNEKESSTDRKFDEEYNNTATNVDDQNQNGTKVAQKELPSGVTSYVSANYPGMLIKSSYLREIDDLGMCYDISVARDGINQEITQLIFDRMGKFLKTMTENVDEPANKGTSSKKEVAVAFTPADTVLNAFKVKHPKASKVIWEEGTENDFVASFNDGTGAHKSYFTANGAWVKVSTVMSPESISLNIKTYVEKNYKGYKINSARSVKKVDKKTYYEVDIAHKKTSDTQTLEFNQAGKPTDGGGKE